MEFPANLTKKALAKARQALHQSNAMAFKMNGKMKRRHRIRMQYSSVLLFLACLFSVLGALPSNGHVVQHQYANANQSPRRTDTQGNKRTLWYGSSRYFEPKDTKVAKGSKGAKGWYHYGGHSIGYNSKTTKSSNGTSREQELSIVPVCATTVLLTTALHLQEYTKE